MVRCVGWLVDRPSKRQRARESPRTGLGVEARAPSAHRRGRSPDAAKSSLRDPAGLVERPIQAPGGRRRRPSRAFFAPHAIRSEANGREPGRPAPPPIPSGGSTVARLDLLALVRLRSESRASRCIDPGGHRACRYRRPARHGPRVHPRPADRRDASGDTPRKAWVAATPCAHLWQAALPASLAPGVQVLQVRAIDEYGREHLARTGLEVTAIDRRADAGAAGQPAPPTPHRRTGKSPPA